MNFRGILEVASQSHPGMVRNHNEDSVSVDQDHGFAVLADGMGGYNAGEVASGIAVTMIADGLRQSMLGHRPKPVGDDDDVLAQGALLRSEVERANAAIYQAAQSQPQCAGMGTTLVAALFHDNRIVVAHVGDSRLYRLRSELFEQVTRDHSLLQEQLDSGMITQEEAKASHNKNLVTRALGVDHAVDVEVHDYAVEPGDLYVLCSDGLNDMVEDDEIALTLAMMGVNLPLAAQQLVQMANDNGGRDNVSVILVRVERPFPLAQGWFRRFLAWFGK